MGLLDLYKKIESQQIRIHNNNAQDLADTNAIMYAFYCFKGGRKGLPAVNTRQFILYNVTKFYYTMKKTLVGKSSLSTYEKIDILMREANSLCKNVKVNVEFNTSRLYENIITIRLKGLCGYKELTHTLDMTSFYHSMSCLTIDLCNSILKVSGVCIANETKLYSEFESIAKRCKY